MPSDSIRVLSKSTELSQVLLNLLNNSIYAIQSLPNQWIEISVITNDEKVEIRITDSGNGIQSDVQSKMMQPFFTSKPFGHGTGLGLSISKSIIASHGGQLFYDENTDHTSFVVQLHRV